MNYQNYIIKSLVIVLSIYLILCFILYFIQNGLIYFPSKISESNYPKILSSKFAGTSYKGIVDSEFHSINITSDKIEPTKTAIWFHGNAGNASGRAFFAEKFTSRGFRLVLAEYPGYGWRGGEPNENQMISEGVNLLEHWQSQLPKDHEIYLVGESLGTGVATQVATMTQKPPNKLILITPFLSAVSVASQKFWMFPIPILMKDKFESDKYINKFKGDIRYLIAGNDDVLGAQSGIDLFNISKTNGKSTKQIISNATHNNWTQLMTDQNWNDLLN